MKRVLPILAILLCTALVVFNDTPSGIIPTGIFLIALLVMALIDREDDRKG